MKSWLIFATLLCMIGLPGADAHRLDEYLQATTIAVESDYVTLQLRLIPGVGVASKVLASIDKDGDGLLSNHEKLSYTSWIGRDLSLKVQGEPVMLRLVNSSFPVVSDIRKGLGGLELTFEAELADGGPDYQLTFANHHQPAIAVYLINCLLPESPNIQIIGQQRNYDQSIYQLQLAITKPDKTYSSSNQPPTDNRPVFKTFLVDGIKHIFGGYDHLLFITALVLAVSSFWELLKIVTIFTLAHSITLTMAALELIYMPGQIIEPLIAASIIVVALQNLYGSGLEHGSLRMLCVFFFGLFHGLGYASGLQTLMSHLPDNVTLWAIAGFCLGLEAGHQLIILPLYCILKNLRFYQSVAAAQGKITLEIKRLGSIGIAAVGAYYFWIAI